MASMLDETMATAKNIMGSARDGSLHAVDAAKTAVESAKDTTGHAVTTARSSLLDGVHAVSGIVSMLRGLDSNDALGWVGLARRRSPFFSMAIFSAGFAVGAGAGVLFAPTSGKQLRGSILKGWKGLMNDAKDVAERAETEAVKIEQKIEHKAEDLAGKAKDKAEDLADKAKETVQDAKVTVASALDLDKDGQPVNGTNKPAPARAQSGFNRPS